MAEYFFTEPNKLNVQTANGFGVIDTNEYRVGNLFSASSTPKAYAVMNGNILAQEVAGNTNILNLVLKPSEQPDLGMPRIDYIIYKGIVKSSLVGSNDVVAASTKNDLTKKIWDSHALQVQEFNIPQPAPPTNPLASEVLGLAYKASATGNYDADDDDSLNKAFYSSESTQFPVEGGDHIGDFDTTSFGIVIVFERIGFKPTFRLARELDSKITFTALGGSPTNAETFRRKHEKEDILNFVDSAAFFGAYSESGLEVFTGLELITGTEFETLTGSDLYDDVISKHLNRNKIYVDVRNEFDDSFNYYENYDNTIQWSLDNTTTLTNVNYYRSEWPVLVVLDSEFDGQNTDKVIRLSFPQGDNESPMLYYRRVYRENLGLELPAGIEQFHVTGIDNSFYDSEALITPYSGGLITSNYYNIKVIKRVNLTDDSENDFPLQGHSFFRRTYLDSLFPIFDMESPFTNANYTNLKVYYDSSYVDKCITNEAILNEDLTDYALRDYVSSMGVAADDAHRTFIAFPYKYHSNFDNNSDFIPLSGMEMENGEPFLIELNDIMSDVNLQRSHFRINGANEEYLRFENNRLDNTATDINEYSFDDVVILSLTNQQFETLEQLKQQNFTGPYKVYLGVKNVTASLDENGNKYTSFTYVLRGITEVNNDIETHEEVTTITSITDAEILGIHSQHVFPIDNPYISSNYGPRVLNGNNFHNGVDLVAQVAANTAGTPVYAARTGIIRKRVTSPDNNDAGVRVRLEADDGLEYNYFHLQTNSNSGLPDPNDPNLTDEEKTVEQGTQIGTVGTTGSSTAPHLHFEIWNGTLNRINPYSVFPELALLPYTRHR